MSLTEAEQQWVQRTRDEILETVDEFVPASDATRIEQNLDALIQLLESKA